ncbi:unnamed protein product, partial [Rotaria sp. Silwood2]
EENEDDKRIWCIATYPSSLQIFNSIIHIFHGLAPFIINLISAVIFITKKFRLQSNVRQNQNHKQLLKEQFQQHKHLFTTHLAIVILGLPRVIIACVSKCMKSTSDAWLFLIGYFIAFLPPMLTFVVFILPSNF